VESVMHDSIRSVFFFEDISEVPVVFLAKPVGFNQLRTSPRNPQTEPHAHKARHLTHTSAKSTH
jgi:hypothetical protein